MRAVVRAFAWTAAFVLGAVSAAQAQTFFWNWSGFYLGLHAGYVQTHSFVSVQADRTSTFPYFNPGQADFFNSYGADFVTARGVDAGIHGGFNWQLKPFAVGIELDYGGFRTRGVRDATLCINSGAIGSFPILGNLGLPCAALLPPGIAQLHSQVGTNWLFTARPRVGWVYSVAFGYITGGVAVTRLGVESWYVDTAGAFSYISGSGTKIGWTIGAGLEVAIAPLWTLRAEYLRVEFPSVVRPDQIVNPRTGAFTPLTFSADLRSDVVRVGVTRKLRWWTSYEPVLPPEPVVVTKD
jgi:outer membrane immunogenic protein